MLLLRSICAVVIGLVVAAMIMLPMAFAVEVPQAAKQYKRELTRNARMIWGLDAPIATFAAQIHQESGWRPDARSPYAHGLAQFTPVTAEWIGSLDPVLGGADTGNPAWAVRALVRYDRWLWDRNPAETPCDRMAFSLSAYNGGEGWLRREQAQAIAAGLAPDRWWKAVEVACHPRRAGWACRENRGYPQRILKIIEPSYIGAGWGAGMCN